MDDPIPISDSLDRMMKSLRGTDRRQVSGVFNRWEDVVGKHVATHVRPLKIDESNLIVEADTPAWATEVKFLSQSIIDQLNDVARVQVKHLLVRVAQSPEQFDHTTSQ